jgi:hypothetical protein
MLRLGFILGATGDSECRMGDRQVGIFQAHRELDNP